MLHGVEQPPQRKRASDADQREHGAHLQVLLQRCMQAEGTVNLPTGNCAKTGRYPLALRGYTQFGDLAPRDHRLRTKRSIVR